jgi:peptidoglycan/LPS O-acetylase OafA/YrhL
MRWVGRLSYSLYLWNSLFFAGMDKARPLRLGALQELPWSILPVFACAALSYYLVERPMIRLGHSLTARRGRPVEHAPRALAA